MIPLQEITIELRGAALALGACRESIVCLDGPAGTGKTRGALEKVHLALLKYPGAKGFLARKTLISLKGSTLATFRASVQHPGDNLKFWAAKGEEPAHYAYTNGSKLYILGLDKVEKVKSWEFDIGLVDEANEISYDDLQMLDGRMRNGIMPYQQIILLTNPGAPSHWLNEQMNAGRIKRLLSFHRDNPRLYDTHGQLTAYGAQYMARLQNLTGVLALRLYKGIWAAAEGAVYERDWDAEIHLLNQFDIPASWYRLIVCDFGYRNPFVAQWWAIDHDNRAYLYREIYMTERIVEQHAATMLKAMGYTNEKGVLKRLRNDADPLPRKVITDHDTEDRYTLEKHLLLMTQPAQKGIKTNIDAVKARLMKDGTGKPGLYVLRDSLVETDSRMVELHRPISTVQEFDAYLWDTSNNQKKGDQPLDQDNHGMDCLGYLVAELDLSRAGVSFAPSPYA